MNQNSLLGGYDLMIKLKSYLDFYRSSLVERSKYLKNPTKHYESFIERKNHTLQELRKLAIECKEVTHLISIGNRYWFSPYKLPLYEIDYIIFHLFNEPSDDMISRIEKMEKIEKVEAIRVEPDYHSFPGGSNFTCLSREDLSREEFLRRPFR